MFFRPQGGGRALPLGAPLSLPVSSLACCLVLHHLCQSPDNLVTITQSLSDAPYHPRVVIHIYTMARDKIHISAAGRCVTERTSLRRGKKSTAEFQFSAGTSTRTRRTCEIVNVPTVMFFPEASASTRNWKLRFLFSVELSA